MLRSLARIARFIRRGVGERRFSVEVVVKHASRTNKKQVLYSGDESLLTNEIPWFSEFSG